MPKVFQGKKHFFFVDKINLASNTFETLFPLTEFGFVRSSLTFSVGTRKQTTAMPASVFLLIQSKIFLISFCTKILLLYSINCLIISIYESHNKKNMRNDQKFLYSFLNKFVLLSYHYFF